MKKPKPITFAEWLQAQEIAAIAKRPDPERLRSLYEDELLTDEQIGQHYGYSASTVGQWRQRAGIITRTASENTRLSRLRKRFEDEMASNENLTR